MRYDSDEAKKKAEFQRAAKKGTEFDRFLRRIVDPEKTES